jgi:hypothetical protein
MAKGKNSAPRRLWIDFKDSREAFRKGLSELKKTLPLDNKEEMEKGKKELRVYVEPCECDEGDGKTHLCVEIPASFIETFETVASGERAPNLRLDHPEANLTERALLGEFEPLIHRFESGAELTEKERRTLAKIARGTLPRMGRPPESKTEIRNRNIVRFVQILRGYGGKRVADVAARKFNIDRSYIPKLERKYPDAAMGDYVLGSLLALFGANPQVVWRARLKSAGVNEDDLREATGRKQKTRK